MNVLAKQLLATDLAAAVIDLRSSTTKLVVPRDRVIDALLDLRNIGAGADLGLEMTVDEMLAALPDGALLSAEWWRSTLAELAEYATFLVPRGR